MESLPNEQIEQILAFVPERKLATCRLVSKRWKDLCERSISKKPIVHVCIATPTVKPNMWNVHNVLVADTRSGKAMLGFLTRIRRASLTFALKVGESESKVSKVLLEFTESFIAANKDSLESLYIYNSTVKQWISLPELPVLHSFFMDDLDSDTLRNLIAACPKLQVIRFRSIEAAPIPDLPKGIKVLANKYGDHEDGSVATRPPLDFGDVARSSALQTLEVLPLLSIPHQLPANVSMPNLTEVAFMIDNESEMTMLPHILSSAPNIQKIRFKISLMWIDEDVLRQFYNRTFTHLKNLTELHLEGVVCTDLFAAVAANCSKLQLINCRTYREDFATIYLLELLPLENLRKVEVVTERLLLPLAAIGEFAEQRAQVGISFFISMKPSAQETDALLFNMLGRASIFIPDVGSIRRRHHKGSAILSIRPAA